MPKTFTDQTATVVGTPLNSSNLNNLLTSADVGVASGVPGLDGNSHVLQQAVYDATEASTMDVLGSASTIFNNLDRLRNQLGVIVGGVGTAWNSAVQMLPLSQKGAASGVPALDASSNLLVPSGGKALFQGQGGGFSAPVGNQALGTFTVASGTANGATVTATNSRFTTSSWCLWSIANTDAHLRALAPTGAFAGSFNFQVVTDGSATSSAVTVYYLILN